MQLQMSCNKIEYWYPVAMDARTPELIAEDLRGVQQALGEITGVFSSEDLLGAIFSTFCIGK